MRDSDKNRYIRCLKVMTSEQVLKPASSFINLKFLEDIYPLECDEIRKALHINYKGI